MKKYTIATAIPYVNDKPHIGHAMDFLYADILARYNRQQGADVQFSIGADEHGQKIAEKAIAAGKKPQEFVDEISQKWQEFAGKLNLSNDAFVRTTSDAHKKGAQQIWTNLAEYIYKDSYSGWYCVGCEEYKTENHVKETNGLCPSHNREYTKLEEENYFFRLSSFNDRLREAISSDLIKVTPEGRKQEMLNLVEEGLEDFSISRTTSKFDWGVPVPGDTSQVMYVWFEALMNYATVLGYPDGDEFKARWPTSVNVVGKDILRFHAITWPAMLMALDLPLPENVYAHGFISANGQKMSKSIGNVVDPLEVIDRHGLDMFRYFFARHIPSHDDGDFSWEKYNQAYGSELANELGNSVSRVASMVQKYQNGVIGDMPVAEHDTSRYHEAIAEFRFDRALDIVWEQLRGLSQYIDETKPWQLAKENDPEHMREVLALMCSDILEVADLLVPFMPGTAAKIKSIFGDGMIRNLDGPMFPRLDS